MGQNVVADLTRRKAKKVASVYESRKLRRASVPLFPSHIDEVGGVDG